MKQAVSNGQLDEFEAFLNRKLFFIIGLPKSGTTWVQHLLNNHSDITCRGESHFFDILFPQIQRCFQHYNKEVLQQGGIVAHLEEYGGHVESLNYRVDDMHMVLLYSIFTMFQKWTKNNESSLILGEKTPDTINHLPLLTSLLPQAKIIHVIRDGRDCATSGWFFNISGMKENEVPARSFDEHICRFLKQWKKNITMAQTTGNTLGDRYSEVKYEDILAQPEQEVSSLIRFLGANDNPQIIDHCVNRARFESMGDGHHQGEERNSAFVRKGISGDWKTNFSSELQLRAWDIAGDMLESLGYEKS